MGVWPDNVSQFRAANESVSDAQRRTFDMITAEIMAARARELRENNPAPPSSEELLCRLMAMPAANGDQLGVKLRFFAIELSKEAEYGQNPDFRLMGYFASIQRDCIILLNAGRTAGTID